MLKVVLLAAAAMLYVTGVQAHGYHSSCAIGDSRLGVVPHFHPGGYGGAQPCGGGGYYDEAPPPPYRGHGGYYRPGYGGANPYGRPGDYGPQTNRGQDCYNVYGRRICCPKGWTVQNGRCEPYRGY